MRPLFGSPCARWSAKTLCAMAVITVSSTFSGACSFDYDCRGGSKCLRARGALEGVCAGGVRPGNLNDDRPASRISDPNGTLGDTCTLDVECGPGSGCVKATGGVQGVCLRSNR